MTSKKKELQIVCNLVWKNRPTNGNEKSNMVGTMIGIFDLPATTVDWETFKSYLLKNSGVSDDNVEVSYVDSEYRENAIRSSSDFERALETFRYKARMDENITLKLDCVDSGKKPKSGGKISKELFEMPKKLNPLMLRKPENPPEWFVSYMKKFREDILEEISAMCSSKTHQISVHHSRKLKADRQRTRKTPLLFCEPINGKDLSKSAKMERELQSKLEKLEHKTLTIKAKKMALRGSSDSDVGRSSSKNDTAPYLPPHSSDQSMNASVLKRELAPHMIGGETYCQTWEITNSGSLPWTEKTELRYAWGSQALKPLRKEIPCPLLQPGQNGRIGATLEVPKIPGTYECYWHFYHVGRRFGHWLGCEVIVDEPPVKNTPYLPSPTYDVINIQDVYELVLPTSWTKVKKQEESAAADFENPFSEEAKFSGCFPMMNVSDANLDREQKKEGGEPKIGDSLDGKDEGKQDINPFSDSDNQSIISISDSSVNSATSEDFVMLKMSPKEEVEEEEEGNREKDGDGGGGEAAVAAATNLSKSKSGSLENINPLFSRLSLQEDETTSLYLDSTVPVGDSEDEAETFADRNEGGNATKQPHPVVVQQIPIDLSNKPVANGEGNGDSDAGYAYVQYKGRKIPISKKHLSPEFLVTAESVPESELKNVEKFKLEEAIPDDREPPLPDASPDGSFRTSTPTTTPTATPTAGAHVESRPEPQPSSHSFCSLSVNNSNDCASTCPMAASMTSSMNENRFFVFPQYYPGYEVVPPLTNGYIDPHNGIGGLYQPMYNNYMFNSVGEAVLVNDWATGLNYTTTVRYPNTPPNPQYYTSVGNSTANTSRGCSSIPNSSVGSPTNHCSAAPLKDHCSCKAENGVNGNFSCCSDRYKYEQESNFNANGNPGYEEDACVGSGGGSVGNGGNSQSSSFASAYNSGGTDQNQNQNQNQNHRPPRSADSRSGNRVPDLLSGATVVATSAINTARSVLNMFVPPRSSDCGYWINGHWISTNPESKREKNLRLLDEMGFYDRNLNATLLGRYNDDIHAVISELLQ